MLVLLHLWKEVRGERACLLLVQSNLVTKGLQLVNVGGDVEKIKNVTISVQALVN